MLKLLCKVLDLDAKSNKMESEECMATTLLNKPAFKSLMEELGDYLERDQVLSHEFLMICAQWIQVFAYIGLHRHTVLDRSLVFNEIRTLLLRLNDERLLSFLTVKSFKTFESNFLLFLVL